MVVVDSTGADCGQRCQQTHLTPITECSITRRLLLPLYYTFRRVFGLSLRWLDVPLRSETATRLLDHCCGIVLSPHITHFAYNSLRTSREYRADWTSKKVTIIERIKLLDLSQTQPSVPFPAHLGRVYYHLSTDQSLKQPTAQVCVTWLQHRSNTHRFYPLTRDPCSPSKGEDYVSQSGRGHGLRRLVWTVIRPSDETPDGIESQDNSADTSTATSIPTSSSGRPCTTTSSSGISKRYRGRQHLQRTQLPTAITIYHRVSGTVGD